jgi:hypothetical protein
MARATASFVAESKKVTFDVKYFRPETSTPVDESCDGLARRWRHPDTASSSASGMDGEATHRVSPIRSLAGLPISGQLQFVL